MYEVFQKLCEEKGVTPYKVSQETGISRPTLTNWKNGRFNLKLENLQKIADYFGVSVNVFIDAKTTADDYLEVYADMKSKELLDKYWDLDVDSRKLVDDFINALLVSTQYKKGNVQDSEVG